VLPFAVLASRFCFTGLIYFGELFGLGAKQPMSITVEAITVEAVGIVLRWAMIWFTADFNHGIHQLYIPRPHYLANLLNIGRDDLHGL
jgi:hypothetical protein